MNSFKDCLNKNFIKKKIEAPEWVKKEEKMAKKFLDSAKACLKNELFEMSVIASYNTILHSSRMLIYSKGFVSKNHACVLVAVMELYKENNEVIEIAKAIRNILSLRNTIQYYGKDADFELADYVFGIAEDYFDLVKGLLRC
jgi:uncharacterized protein (UPF0332 family)